MYYSTTVGSKSRHDKTAEQIYLYIALELSYHMSFVSEPVEGGTSTGSLTGSVPINGHAHTFVIRIQPPNTVCPR